MTDFEFLGELYLWLLTNFFNPFTLSILMRLSSPSNTMNFRKQQIDAINGQVLDVKTWSWTRAMGSMLAEQVGCQVTQYEEQKVAACEGLGKQARLLAGGLEIKFITVICASKASRSQLGCHAMPIAIWQLQFHATRWTFIMNGGLVGWRGASRSAGSLGRNR